MILANVDFHITLRKKPQNDTLQIDIFEKQAGKDQQERKDTLAEDGVSFERNLKAKNKIKYVNRSTLGNTLWGDQRCTTEYMITYNENFGQADKRYVIIGRMKIKPTPHEKAKKK